MKTPKTLYILIGVFCIFAVIAGIYAQTIEGKGNVPATPNKGNDKSQIQKDAATIKAEFQALFTNTLHLNGFDTTGIVKKSEDKEIIYTAFDMSKDEEAYELNIKVPVVNINNEVANSFNAITQAIFVTRANEVLAKTDTTSKTIYSIDYVGYVNGDILSLIIKSTLKEGTNAQRVMVQTYNYDLVTGQSVSLNDMITRKALNKEEVNQKIKTVVQEADNEAKTIQNMGYETSFSRDLNSTMYTVDNSSTFFLGENNQLYVIYAYGNQNFTSEMDIVLFE